MYKYIMYKKYTGNSPYPELTLYPNEVANLYKLIYDYHRFFKGIILTVIILLIITIIIAAIDLFFISETINGQKMDYWKIINIIILIIAVCILGWFYYKSEKTLSESTGVKQYLRGIISPMT